MHPRWEQVPCTHNLSDLTLPPRSIIVSDFTHLLRSIIVSDVTLLLCSIIVSDVTLPPRSIIVSDVTLPPRSIIVRDFSLPPRSIIGWELHRMPPPALPPLQRHTPEKAQRLTTWTTLRLATCRAPRLTTERLSPLPLFAASTVVSYMACLPPLSRLDSEARQRDSGGDLPLREGSAAPRAGSKPSTLNPSP